jgi:tetratricopeptide (TPR) repeat protein
MTGGDGLLERSSNKALIASLALILLTLIAFLPALDNGFVNFDDPMYLTNTPWIDDGITTAGLVWAFTHYHAGNWHPLTTASHMLDGGLFGRSPRGHHLTSVLFHTANGVLLFVLLWKMTGSVWRSAMVAAIFAMHPLRVESVAWISGRKDLLSTFFALLSVGAYLGWLRRRTVAAYSLVLVFFSLALMSKATVVTLPCLLLLLDIWPLRRMEIAGFRWRPALNLAVEKLPLCLLALAAGVVSLFAQNPTMAIGSSASTGLRVANAINSYGAYLRKTFFPFDLAAYYPYPEAIAGWKVLISLTLLIVVTGWSLRALRRSPYFAVGWLWFVGTLFPVIGLLKVGDQAMADRYTYLPSIGLAIAVVWGIHSLLGRRQPNMLLVALLAVLAYMVFLTHLQIGHWADSTRLFRHTLAVTENNYFAEYNYAKALLDEGGDPRESESHFRAAVELRPEISRLQAGLGQALRIWGKPEEALGHLEEALELGEDRLRTHHEIAMTLDELGREGEAIDHLRAMLEIDPSQVIAHGALADLLSRSGENEAALEHCRAVLALVPGFAEQRLMAAQILGRLGRLEEAAAELVIVLEQQPNSFEAHQSLAIIRERQGDLDGARRHFEAAEVLQGSNEIRD